MTSKISVSKYACSVVLRVMYAHEWSVLWGDRLVVHGLASQAPRKGMRKQSRHSSSHSLAFSYSLHFSFKKLDWTWYATAMKENQSSCPIKFTPRQTKSCDMPNTKCQGVLSCSLAFMFVVMYWCLTCAGGVCVCGMWILHGEDRSVTL